MDGGGDCFVFRFYMWCVIVCVFICYVLCLCVWFVFFIFGCLMLVINSGVCVLGNVHMIDLFCVFIFGKLNFKCLFCIVFKWILVCGVGLCCVFFILMLAYV